MASQPSSSTSRSGTGTSTVLGSGESYESHVEKPPETDKMFRPYSGDQPARAPTRRHVERESEKSKGEDDIDNGSEKLPNGGYGWVCVGCVFWINVCTWGISSSYGIFLAHYLSTKTFPGATTLQYAFIAGLSVSQGLLFSPLITSLRRIFSTRTILLMGVLLQFTALVGTSFATKIWHLFLSFGLLFGWGTGFFIVSTAGIIPQWFSTRRSLANGIATAGVGVGGIIYSLGTSAMIQHIGLAWTWRVLALTSGVTTFICALLIRDRNSDILPHYTAFDLKLLRRPELILFLGWGFFSELGYVILWFSLPDYALSIGLTPHEGSIIGALLNLGLVVGRPFVGFLSDWKGRLNIITFLTTCCGFICLFVWIFAKSFSLICAFAFFAGLVCGTFWGTMGPVGAEVVGLKDLPSALNLTFMVLVLPATFAEAIALKLRRPSGGDVYLDTQIFTGFMFLTSAMCAWSLRSLKVMKVDYELGLKARRKGSSSTSEAAIIEQRPNPDALSKRWTIQLVKGLVAHRNV